MTLWNNLIWDLSASTCNSIRRQSSYAAPIRETNSGAGAPAFCGHPVLHSVEPETETIVKNSWWFYSIKFENKRCFFHCMWTCEYKKISFQRGTFKKKFKTWKFALSWDLCEIKDFSCVYMCPSYEFLERVSDWCLCKACLMLRWYFHVCFVFFLSWPLRWL